MDCYFLKIKITEFTYKSNTYNINTFYEYSKNVTKREIEEEKYEIEFELKKCDEKYILEIINDNKGNKVLFSNYFTLSTKININNKNNIEYDYLEIMLYSKIGNNRKLIDIDKGKLIDENCINNKKLSVLNLGNFMIKYTYKLTKFEDLLNSEEKENLIENNNILYENINCSEDNKKENVKDYEDNLFEELDPIINEEKNNLKKDIYHNMNSPDFFDINVDIFEEEETEEENEKGEKNPFESAYKKNIKKIYRNTHITPYEIIELEKPILKEIMKDNLIECFLISGLSQNKNIIQSSKSYNSQCNHKNCELNQSYSSEIFYRIQKPNSIFEEIESNLLTNLIFPSGIKICFGKNFFKNLVKKRSSLQFKKTDYSFNVLTDINGKRYYIYSIIFFIKFELDEFIVFYKEYSDIKGINNKFNIEKNDIFVPFSFSIISKIFDITKFNIILKDLYTTFNTNEMKIELFDNELVHLLFETPVPPINSKIKIFLPNSQVEIYSNVYENKNYKNINIYNIFFCKYSYKLTFIIKIFILLLLEKKIIFHSAINKKIYLTIEAFLTLIYPFKWVNTYIPLIPQENIDLILQSFLPFIIGMTSPIFFNYINKINRLNNSKDDNDEKKFDKIFIINLDKENITPNNEMNEIIDKCPVFDFFEDEYIKNKNSGEINNEKLKNIFFDAIILLIGDFEKFTSKLGENILFNQEIFLENKPKKYEQFYKDITSTQQFFQFINEYNNRDDFLYLEEFREKLKSKSIKNLRETHKIEKEKEIYINEYYLYPYFFQKNKELESDLFNFEDEIDLYYNCQDKEHEINYLLSTEAFIRIKLVLKNYVPEKLKKYSLLCEDISNIKNNNKTKDFYMNSYDSNLSMSEIELDKFENIKNIFDNLYGRFKNSITKIIPRKTSINSYYNDNKENISSNINNKIEYRHRNSLIKMIRENNNKKELLKYKEQIIDLLKDYMGYILSNQNTDIIFSMDELSKLLKYRRIRREFSKILFQKKFEKNIEHELSEETFELLYQSVYFSIINMNDNQNEYKTLRRIIKSMFYYFHKRKKGLGKIYLYQKFLEKNEAFYYKKSLNFWKYYYNIEKSEYEENGEHNYDKNWLIKKIKNEMFLIDVDDDIVNFFE